MIISGDVEKIIFRNEDNGYTVVDLRSSGDYVTAVGVFPEIYEGMRLELTGDYTYHTKHGLQFLAESVKVVEPDGAAAIEKFLKSGIFKGVGEVTARNIVERFGERTLDVMKTSPEKLAEVKGISAKKAAEICATLREHGEMQDTLVYLHSDSTGVRNDHRFTCQQVFTIVLIVIENIVNKGFYSIIVTEDSFHLSKLTLAFLDYIGVGILRHDIVFSIYQFERIRIEFQLHNTALIVNRTCRSILHSLCHIVNIDIITKNFTRISIF